MDRPSERIDLERGDAYGRSFGDVYDRWYGGVTNAEATADFLAARHAGGPVLEIGVGTGRLARPLAARGLTVVGLDASSEMLDHCPAGRQDDDGAIHRVRADMRALPIAGRPFGSVLVAFNTLFNLTTEAAQKTLLADLAGMVTPGGVVVIEILDLSALLDGPDHSIGRRDTTTDPVVITATELDRTDQRLLGQHLEISDRGVVVRPWMLRWATPDQLDAMAEVGGLALAERYGSWVGAPVGVEPSTVISVYRPH